MELGDIFRLTIFTLNVMELEFLTKFRYFITMIVLASEGAVYCGDLLSLGLIFTRNDLLVFVGVNFCE